MVRELCLLAGIVMRTIMSGQSLLYIKMKTMPGGNRYLYITVYYHYPNCAKALQDETELALGQVKDAFAHLRNFRAACPRNLSPLFLTTTGTSSLIKWPKPTGGRTTLSSYWIIRQYLALIFYVMHRKITVNVWNHQNPRFILLFEKWRIAKLVWLVWNNSWDAQSQ